MLNKKKVVFYSYLTVGHLNLCVSIGSTLLNQYPDEIEIYFFSDQTWAEKKVVDLIKEMESLLNLPNIDRFKEMFKIIVKGEDYFFTDQQLSNLIKKIKPDFILCDLQCHMPSVVESTVPYGFVISSNPLSLDVEGFPPFGIDVGVDDDKKVIEDARKLFKEATQIYEEKIRLLFEKRNVKFGSKYSLIVPRSNFMSIYCYPKELDYFDDKIRENYNLLRVDSPIMFSKLPPPFQLPEDFLNLPGKIIYVSLGSLYSCYHDKLQKLIDVLATLPYKFIVSKGPNGEKLIFPNNRFIGENYVDQLAVLQVVDMIIAHGGNNTFTECFHLGVPSIILPVMGDQINNARHIEETGYGYQLDLMNYTKDDLKEKIEKIFSNKSLIDKYNKISERIKNEKSLEKIAKTFFENLKQI
uniref:UDP-glycosyltransferase n=1 Tax=Polyphagotarsonemus latus TaxID=1204166 RepID=A0AAN0LM61_9ACAR